MFSKVKSEEVELSRTSFYALLVQVIESDSLMMNKRLEDSKFSSAPTNTPFPEVHQCCLVKWSI